MASTKFNKPVDGEIASLSEQIATKEVILTCPYCTTPETAYVRRCGNVVQWQITMALTTALSMGVEFARLPVGFRPNDNKHRFTCYNSSDKKAILVDLGAAGDLRCIDYATNLAVGTVLQLSGTFII